MASRESTVEAPAAAVTGAGFPRSCWPALIEALLLRRDIYVVMTDAEWRVEHASPAFQSELAHDGAAVGRSFRDLLADDSVTALSHLLEDGALENRTLELHHRVKAGTRIIEYTFSAVESGWLAVGRDQSVQFELVNQMAVLVEDLEAKIDREKALGDELRVLAARDALTGLPNRRHLEELLKRMATRYRKQGRGFSVVCLDVDHFKSVNDTYGHVIGDEVLRKVAQVLRGSIRDRDCATRYGGEEFVVVLDAAAEAECRVVAERLRCAVEEAKMPEPLRCVTVSVGVACTRPDGQDGQDGQDRVSKLFELADQALYAAKEAGRNCVRFAE